MKNFILAALLFAISLPVMALDGQATVGVDSQFAERGVLVTNTASAYVDTRFANIGIRGLFVDANVRALNLDLNDPQLRIRAGVGYQFGGERSNASIAVYNVSSQTAPTFNEVRLTGRVGVTESLAVIGRAAYTLNQDTHDAYLAGGLSYNFTPNFAVQGLVSGYYYHDAGTSRWQNAELTATYQITDGLRAYATYSKAGDPLTYQESEDNYVVAGINYTF